MRLPRAFAMAGCLLLFTAPIVASTQGPPPLPPPPPPPMASAQPRDSATQKTGTARLSGRVTALDTGRPIRRAVVRASGQALRDGKSVSTDAEGRWELREIPPGRLAISVSKGGYVGLSYGQQRPFEGGKTVDVADGAVVEKLDVALPRGGAVTGRVVDEFGEAVTGASVTPMRFRYVNGQRQLAPLGSSDTTDDLGQYRLHGLPPGDYYVSARPTGFTFLGTSQDRSGYGTTYYPGALNISEASRLSVGVGQEAQNVVISLAPSRVANLSGTATLSNGKPVKQGFLMTRHRGEEAAMTVRPALIQDGAWTISGMAPGEYQLVAQVVDLEAIAATGTTAGIQATELVMQNVTVTGEDITGIALVTAVGGTARGSIRFEGAAPPAAPASMSSVIGVDTLASGLPLSASGLIKPDWTFEMKGLMGRRKLVLNGAPQGWTIKAVTVDGTDVIDSGIEVNPGEEVSNIEILLTNRAAEVSGHVQDSKGNAVTDFAVVIFASDPQRWGWQSRYVRVARPDQTGRFLVGGLPQGSYLAVALDYVEAGEEANTEFLERLKPLGTSVRLDEGDKKMLTLKLSSQ